LERVVRSALEGPVEDRPLGVPRELDALSGRAEVGINDLPASESLGVEKPSAAAFLPTVVHDSEDGPGDAFVNGDGVLDPVG
jgi:hypothetical protein